VEVVLEGMLEGFGVLVVRPWFFACVSLQPMASREHPVHSSLHSSMTKLCDASQACSFSGKLCNIEYRMRSLQDADCPLITQWLSQPFNASAVGTGGRTPMLLPTAARRATTRRPQGPTKVRSPGSCNDPRPAAAMPPSARPGRVSWET